jgi:uncharacterized delta-60 repeat protein
MKKSSWCIVLGIAVLFLASGCGGGGGTQPDTSPHSVGGMVSGLTTGRSVTLQLNGAEEITVNGDADGVVSFTFDTQLMSGDDYAVTISAHTVVAGHSWSAANAKGTVNGANVTDVQVSNQLDATFSGDGIVVNNGAAALAISSSFRGDDIGYATAIDSSGNIYVVGRSQRSQTDSDMTIWRYDSTGALDTDWGEDGIVTYDGGHGSDIGYGIALNAAGTYVYVTGMTTIADGQQVMAVWRYNTSGTRPAGFGTNGVATYTDYTSSVGYSIAVDANGKPLIAGSRYDDGSNSHVLMLWRFTTAGIADPAFDADGFAYFDGSGQSMSGNFEACSLTLEDPADANTSIFVTGYFAALTDNIPHMAVWKYENLDGSLDALFGINSGIYVYGYGSSSGSSGLSIKLDGDGKILAAGFVQEASDDADMAVWRLNGNGHALDTANFNSPLGYTKSNGAAGGNGTDKALSLALDGDGNIIIVGESQNGEGIYDMALWKYDSDGTADDTFGLDGVLVDNSAAGGYTGAAGNAVAIDDDGNIVITGYSDNTVDNADMVIWRYLP